MTIKSLFCWDDIWLSHWYSDSLRRHHRAVSKINAITKVIPLDAIPQNAEILDIGGGDGRFGLSFLARLCSPGAYTILEASKVALSKAHRTLSNYKARFIYSTIEEFSSGHSLYDVLCMICVLEHNLNPRFSLEKALYNLKTNGTFICVYSNKRSFFYVQRRVLSIFRPWPFGHQTELTRHELLLLMPQTLGDLRVTSLHADSDFIVCRFLDQFMSYFLDGWARYHVIVGCKI